MKKTRLFQGLMLMVSIAMFFSSCEVKVEEYPFTGTVTNASDIAVKNATLTLTGTEETSGSYSVTTSSDGSYSFDGVEEGSYDLKVSADGYVTSEYTATIVSSMDEDLKIYGAATITGKIINSQTGSGLSGATVSFSYDAASTNSASAEVKATTSSDGSYTIYYAPTGTFTRVIESDDFYTRITHGITITSGYNYMDNITSVENLTEGQLRVVLSWGENPHDLDTHVTGPMVSGGKFHVYYGHKTDSNVSLDVDDTYSYGPETTTFTSFVDGTYRYSVYNYSTSTTAGASGIYSSPAKVEVFDYTGLIRTFYAPMASSTSGNTWRVFEINVNSGVPTVSSVNTYVTATGSSDVGTFKSTDKSSIIYDIVDF